MAPLTLLAGHQQGNTACKNERNTVKNKWIIQTDFENSHKKNSCVYNPSDLVEVVVTEVASSTQGPLQWQAASNQLLTYSLLLSLGWVFIQCELRSTAIP